MIGLCNPYDLDSRDILPTEIKNNLMNVIKDNLLVSNIINNFPIYQYVHFFLKTFGLGHPEACIYQFIGDDT